MQAALASAVLMLSCELSQGTISTSHIGSKNFTPHYNSRDATDVSIDVNVGTSNVNASWLRWDSWDPTNYRKSWYPYNPWCSWTTMAKRQAMAIRGTTRSAHQAIRNGTAV